jgi:hypothetical protein
MERKPVDHLPPYPGGGMKHSASELALQEYIKRLMSGPEVIGTETRDGDVKDVKPAEVLDHRDRDSFSDELDGFYSDTCFSDINNFAFKPRVSTVSLSLSLRLSVCLLLGSTSTSRLCHSDVANP